MGRFFQSSDDESSEIVVGGFGNRVESRGRVVEQRWDGTYVDGRKVSDHGDAAIQIGRGGVYVNGERVR
jgi:hypothetical protein